MSILKEKGIIKEIESGNNFEYVLEDGTQFLEAEYKILQGQMNNNFLPCMKILRNGKTDLYYLVDNYRSISSMCKEVTQESLMIILQNIFNSVIEVKQNDFLTCQNIDLSWKKIFVHPDTLKVKLVYLPLSIKLFNSIEEFELELRLAVVGLLNRLIPVPEEKLQCLTKYLNNRSILLEEIVQRLEDNNITVLSDSCGQAEQKKEKDEERNEIKLVSLNQAESFEIVIDKDNVLIGKRKDLVDVVIPFSHMISRKHCRIWKKDGRFYIEDESSANGTYINQKRLDSGRKYPLNKGDIVRLANCDFEIV